MNDTNTIVECQGLSKIYGKTIILPKIDLKIKQGSFVSLLGPSGCGKTTLLRLIAGLEEPSDGKIFLKGECVAGQNKFVPPEKRHIGMVFQSYAIWPHMTVFENIAYPLRIQKFSKQAISEKVQTILNTLKMTKLGGRMPDELSGGQQQRVALGRALVMDPVTLLLDEPLSNLDAKLRVEMRQEMKGMQHKYNTTIIYVTHDQDEAFDLSDRIVLMNQGNIEQDGTPAQIRANPASEFVREFLR